MKHCGAKLSVFIYEGPTESHEKLFFPCELGTADEGEYGGRWNQLLCYPWLSCDVNSLHHVTSITPNKMPDNDMSFRQSAVIEFLVKEEIPTAEIYQRLQRAYGSVCVWVRAVFEDGWNILKMGTRASKMSLGAVAFEQPPLNATRRVDEIIQDDRRVTMDTIARTLGIGHNAVQEMIDS